VDVGVRIPHSGPHADPAFVPRFCAAAEAAGFAGLWAVDHVLAPIHTDSMYTLGPVPTPVADGAISATMGLNLEMNTTLAVAAAVTSRVKLCTGVAVLPIRNAVLHARQIASIDLYSGGRVVLGVGVGWLREEADAMSMPWDRRGTRSEEHIALLRALWTATGDVVEFHGKFHDLPPVDPEPRPVQRPIPILVGGHSEAALDRVARIGDGWVAAGMGPERLARSLDVIAAACARERRDFSQLQIVCDVRAPLDPARGDLESQCERIVADIAARRDLGIGHVKISIAGDHVALLEGLAACGELVIPEFRSGGPAARGDV
jgi:probable F420-dependent oxidoreductase